MSDRWSNVLKRVLGRGNAGSPSGSVLHHLIREGTATLGQGTYGEPQVFVWDSSTRLTIGAFCSIADGVRIILGGEHRTDWVTTAPLRVLNGLPGAWEDGHPKTKGDILIGNDVWIATGATILSGITIGDGAVIGAGAVVSKDVPPFAIVGGNPAAILRYRFPEAARDALLRIAWWDWPLEDVLDAVDLLCSPDIDAFIERFDPQNSR